MGNIQNGKIDWSDLVYSDDEEEISKYLLKPNDVLFNRTNSPELVGKVGIYKGEQPAIFAGYLIRINYIPTVINPVYLCYILNSSKVRKHGFSVMSKSINQANINGSLLKQYKIPVPTLDEQNAIVAKIEKFEQQIDAAQKVLDSAFARKQAILDKFLQ
jgi:restriction endonuclease S subunit